MDKIHANRQEAEKACKEYVEGVWALQEKHGVSEECEDSCANMIIKAKYLDSNGKIQQYYHC